MRNIAVAMALYFLCSASLATGSSCDLSFGPDSEARPSPSLEELEALLSEITAAQVRRELTADEVNYIGAREGLHPRLSLEDLVDIYHNKIDILRFKIVTQLHAQKIAAVSARLFSEKPVRVVLTLRKEVETPFLKFWKKRTVISKDFAVDINFQYDDGVLKKGIGRLAIKIKAENFTLPMLAAIKEYYNQLDKGLSRLDLAAEGFDTQNLLEAVGFDATEVHYSLLTGLARARHCCHTTCANCPIADPNHRRNKVLKENYPDEQRDISVLNAALPPSLIYYDLLEKFAE
jgi:hypothetical protein